MLDCGTRQRPLKSALKIILQAFIKYLSPDAYVPVCAHAYHKDIGVDIVWVSGWDWLGLIGCKEQRGP